MKNLIVTGTMMFVVGVALAVTTVGEIIIDLLKSVDSKVDNG
jgi:hypothetical protein